MAGYRSAFSGRIPRPWLRGFGAARGPPPIMRAPAFCRPSMVSPTAASPQAPMTRTVARLGRFLAPYRGRFVIGGIALLIAAACTLAIGQGLKLVIDRGFRANDAFALDQALAALLAVIATMSIATYVRFYNVSWIGERVTADIRRKVFEHLLGLSPGFFEITRTGEVVSRLTNDATMLETVIGSSLSLALRNTVLGVGALVLLTLTSLKLTLLVLAGLPVVLLPIILFGRRVRRLSRASQDRVADTGSYVDEAVHEIRTVQAYGHEQEDRKAYADRVEAAFQTGVRRIRQRGLLIATRDLPGVRRSRHHPLDRRARRVGGQAFGRRALGLRLLRGDRRRIDRRGKRSRGRIAACSGCHGAAAGAARYAAGHCRARPSGAAARPAAGDARARKGYLRLSLAAGRTGAQGGVVTRRRGRARGAGRPLGCGQDHGVSAAAAFLRPANGPDRCSTGSTCDRPTRARCGGASRWCRRSR